MLVDIKLKFEELTTEKNMNMDELKNKNNCFVSFASIKNNFDFVFLLINDNDFLYIFNFFFD